MTAPKTSAFATTVPKSGATNIDALLSGDKWGCALSSNAASLTISYSFPWINGLIAGSLFLLIGCAPIDGVTKRNTQGQPQNYVNGFQSGCASGYVAAGHPYAKFEKNIEKLIGDQIYKTGWDDGFNVCKGDYESISRSRR